MALLLMVLQVVIAVVASVAWMSVSSGLILLNKDLLSHGFHYPMALSGLGMAFSGTASYLCCRVRGGRPVGVAAPTPGAAAPAAAAAAAGSRLHGSLARLSAFLPYQLPAHLPPVFPACLPACLPSRALPRAHAGIQVCGCQEDCHPPLLRLKNPPRGPADGADPPLWQPGLPLPHCRLHSDAQGAARTHARTHARIQNCALLGPGDW
jgi:hypothetical protein